MHAWVDEAVLIEPSVIDAGVLQQIMPTCDDIAPWVEPVVRYLDLYGLDSTHEVAMFLAHIGHESADMTRLEENLNYSTEALGKLFGSHRITPAEIEAYGRKPGQRADQEALANCLYGGEWGRRNLGNTAPGDGWKYRGRGLIQLTGKANYQRCSAGTGMDLLEDPDLLLEPAASVDAALWFWRAHVTGRDMKTTTRQINGGYHGLEDRIGRYHRAMSALEG